MHCHTQRLAVYFVAFGLACLAAVDPARAEIVDISGVVETRVTELLNGQPTNVDSSIERYPETTGVLPMTVESGITDATPSTVQGIGLALSRLKDPRGTTGPVPEELNLDAAAYAGFPSTSFDVASSVTEARRIRTDFQLGGPAEGEEGRFFSNFYIQGLLLAVSQSDDRDLTGLRAEVRVIVVHERPGQDPITRLDAAYMLLGQPDGTIALALAGRAEPGKVVEQDLAPFISDFASARVALFPNVNLQYDYEATIGQESTLIATLKVHLIALPDGTGVGAAFGMPGDKIGLAVDSVLGGSTGTSTVQAINTQIANLPATSVQPLTNPDASGLLALLPGFCGSFGVIASMALLAMMSWTGLRRRD